MKRTKISAKSVAVTGMVAAIYAVLTVALAPIGFDAVQVRIAEVMLALFLLDRRFAPGLILGCAIANFFSPLGLIDVAVGTTATALALWGMSKTPSPKIALLWPAITNGILVGLELHLIDNLPFWLSAAGVALGEVIAVWVLGGVFYAWLNKSGLFRTWLSQR